MVVLGNDDLRTAEYAAQLLLDSYANYAVLSGKASRFSSHFLPLSEADKFAEVMVKEGVSKELLFLEHEATNTGENFLFSQQLLQKLGKTPQSFLIVTKPYMERRALATVQKVWPNQKVTVTSPQLSLSEFLDDRHSLERVTKAMIGYVYRMRDYVTQGFQVEQEIPGEVWNACHQLEKLGFQRT